MKDGGFTLVSRRSAGHLGIEYIVVQSAKCMDNVAKIKNQIAYAVIITAFLIIIIAVFLSYMFLKPIRDKMQEIEEFVKDATHEFNTPIEVVKEDISYFRELLSKKNKNYNNKE